MPHYKCTQCHHEWDAIPRHPGLVENYVIGVVRHLLYWRIKHL
jgi:hypothetical protein